ncbi:hypothetical protein PGB90_008299 [Kerria lacca]
MEEKSKEEILAERKQRKAAKQLKKKSSNKVVNESHVKDKIKGNLEENLDKMKISQCDNDALKTSNESMSVNPDLMTHFLDNDKKFNFSSNNTSFNNETSSNISISNKECGSGIGNGINTFMESVSDNIKTKSQLKSERRAKQEAQRALKTQKKLDEKNVEQFETSKIKVNKLKTKFTHKIPKTVDVHKVLLFSHLYRNSSIEENNILTNINTEIHKAVLKLGVQYKNKVIIGSNARVVALLNTLKQVIADYRTPTEKDFSRGFEKVLGDVMTYLNNCRPVSVSMTNAIKFLKWHLSQLPNNISDREAQIKLREAIDDYIKEQINMAGKAICIMVQKKISQDDVILTFGYSSLIERILIESFQVGIKFRVIIVDAAPLYEGKELLRRLVKSGLNCVYVLLSAVSYIMKEADKVLLGAHALLTNGYVMSRAGSSQIALIARSYNVPVLVCCETHKFSERVQTDAFVHNELGNPEELMKADLWKSNNNLTPLTLMYEVTPSNLVTAVVTELAILPCTSVPVVLRVKPTSSTLS